MRQMLPFEQGGDGMSRRRTGKTYVPISISLPSSMIEEMEVELGPNDSRSKWIARAIRTKLDGETLSTTIADASTLQLLVVLRNRGLLDEVGFAALRALVDGHSIQ